MKKVQKRKRKLREMMEEMNSEDSAGHFQPKKPEVRMSTVTIFPAIVIVPSKVNPKKHKPETLQLKSQKQALCQIKNKSKQKVLNQTHKRNIPCQSHLQRKKQ